MMVAKRYWTQYKKPRLNVTIQKLGSLRWVIQNEKGKKPAKNLSLLVNFHGSKRRLFWNVNLSESDEIIVEFRFLSESVYPKGAFWIASNIPQSVEKSIDHGGDDWGPLPLPTGGKSDFELFFSGRNLRSSDSKPRKYRLCAKSVHEAELVVIREPSRKAMLRRSIRSVSFARFRGSSLVASSSVPVLASFP